MEGYLHTHCWTDISWLMECFMKVPGFCRKIVELLYLDFGEELVNSIRTDNLLAI